MSFVIGGGGTAGSNGAGLIREVWRGFVRGSRLGKEEDAKKAVDIFTGMSSRYRLSRDIHIHLRLSDPQNASAWAPFLFLTELYTHTLITMGDDEFFSSSPSASARAPVSSSSNPLSLDELTTFSRQLLNVAFPLFWHEDQTNLKEGNVPGTRLTWEAVRDKVTRCLQSIHARE